MLKQFLLVGAGAAAGAMMRFAANLVFKAGSFPLATFIVNVTGSLVIGMVLGYALKNPQFSVQNKLFLVTGICGGFTTFSAFSAENYALLQDGKYAMAAAYMAFSVLLGIGATFLGFKIFQ